MILHPMSHTDHVSQIVLGYVLGKFENRTGFFKETFELPTSLPLIRCDLHGPACGDEPVEESEVVYQPRPGRVSSSRLVRRPSRLTRTCTVIAGPYEGQSCVLYTVFGGPPAPKEVADPTLSSQELEQSKAFWAEHALSFPHQEIDDAR